MNFDHIDKEFEEKFSFWIDDTHGLKGSVKSFLHDKINEALTAQNQKHQVLVLEAEKEARLGLIKKIMRRIKEDFDYDDFVSYLKALKNQSL